MATDTSKRKLAAKLRANGLTYKQIAAELGIHQNTVWKYVHDQDGSYRRRQTELQNERRARARATRPILDNPTPDEERDALLECGRNYVEEYGRPPIQDDMGSSYAHRVRVLFGSWSQYVNALGYFPSSSGKGYGQRVPTGPILEAFDEWQARTGKDLESIGCDDYPADTLGRAISRCRAQKVTDDRVADMILTRIGCQHLWMADPRLWGVGCVPFDGPGF